MRYLLIAHACIYVPFTFRFQVQRIQLRDLDVFIYFSCLPILLKASYKKKILLKADNDTVRCNLINLVQLAELQLENYTRLHNHYLD